MRHHMAQRVGPPRDDTQRAGCLLMHLPRLDHRGVEAFQQRRDAGGQAPAGLGWRNMAGCAVKQPQRQVILQLAQRPRRRRGRQPERAPRCRDAAAIKGAQKKPESGQPVHVARLERLWQCRKRV